MPSRRSLAKIEVISLHHSASGRSTTSADIDEWHRARGFDGIGYNALVLGGGEITICRPADVIPAANRGQNTRTYAICAVGHNGQAGQEWTAVQRGAISRLVEAVRLVLGRRIPVEGHGFLPDQHTECPGLTREEIRAIA